MRNRGILVDISENIYCRTKVVRDLEFSETFAREDINFKLILWSGLPTGIFTLFFIYILESEEKRFLKL